MSKREMRKRYEGKVNWSFRLAEDLSMRIIDTAKKLGITQQSILEMALTTYLDYLDKLE